MGAKWPVCTPHDTQSTHRRECISIWCLIQLLPCAVYICVCVQSRFCKQISGISVRVKNWKATSTVEPWHFLLLPSSSRRMHHSEISITRAQPDKRNANESGVFQICAFNGTHLHFIFRSHASGRRRGLNFELAHAYYRGFWNKESTERSSPAITPG